MLSDENGIAEPIGHSVSQRENICGDSENDDQAHETAQLSQAGRGAAHTIAARATDATTPIVTPTVGAVGHAILVPDRSRQRGEGVN